MTIENNRDAVRDLGLTTGIISHALKMPMLKEGDLYEDRFVIGEYLGSGSAFQVYRALDTAHEDMVVALKVLNALVPYERACEMFLIERLRARSVNNHRVVKMIDASRPELSEFWFAYELMEGGSLYNSPEGTPVATGYRDRMREMADLCEGLDAIHRMSVIHRDLKPQNILLDTNGHAKIGDLGIAAKPGEPGARGSGTVLFTDPAGLKGDAPNILHDIYAMAGIAYWWMTGNTPNNEAGECCADFSGLPMRLSQVLTKAMSERPEDRHKSASQLADDFRALAERRPLASMRTSPAARVSMFAARRPLILTGSVLSVLGIAGASAFGLSAYVDAERERTVKQHTSAIVTMFEGSSTLWSQSDNHSGAMRLIAQHGALARAIDSAEGVEITTRTEIGVYDRALADTEPGSVLHTMGSVNLAFALAHNSQFDRALHVLDGIVVPSSDPIHEHITAIQVVCDGDVGVIRHRLESGISGVDQHALEELAYGRLLQLAKQSGDESLMEYARDGLKRASAR